MVQVALYTEGDYVTLAQAAYDGNGERVRLTTWAESEPMTVTFAVFQGQLLLADAVTQTTLYLHGWGLVAEYDGGEWSYHLRDGIASVRQVVDESGDVTLARVYKPFGGILQEQGLFETEFGFLGAQLDQISGLLYANGRYYDPVTGRFLTPNPIFDPFNPRTLNPYVPLFGPALWLLAAGAFAILKKKKPQNRKHWLSLMVVITLMMPLNCENRCGIIFGGKPSPTATPTTPPPTGTSPPPTPAPTPAPTGTSSPPSPTPTPTPTECPGEDEEEDKEDELARITVDEIQTAGGMEAYLRSEPDAALLTRVAMAESTQSAKDRGYVMWIIRLRMEIAYSVNVAQFGQKTTLQEEVFDSGQFETIPHILNVVNPRDAALRPPSDPGGLGCGGQINAAIYPCDSSGLEEKAPDPDDPNAIRLAEWYSTYDEAQGILSVPSAEFTAAFPEPLRRCDDGEGCDGFLGESSDSGIQFFRYGNKYVSTTTRDVEWL